MSIKNKREFKYNIITLLISIFISLIGSELILRNLKMGYNNSPINPSSFAHHEHPYNFEYSSYSPQGEWDNFIIKYDEYGNREIEDNCLKSVKKSKEIIFIGDSFTESRQVNNQNSFPNIIHDKLCKKGVKVHNFGVSSYSPVLSYLHLLHQYENNKNLNFNNDSHLFHVLVDNDIRDDLKYSKMITETSLNGETKLVINTKDKVNPFIQISRRSYLVRLIRRFFVTIHGYLDPKRLPLNDFKLKFSKNDKCIKEKSELLETEKYIMKIKSFANSKNVEYTLTALPYPPRKNRNNIVFSNLNKSHYSCYRKIAEKLNIPFLEASDLFFDQASVYYFKKDVHLNSLGNHLLANEILDYISEWYNKRTKL